MTSWPKQLPRTGIGERRAAARLTRAINARSIRLDAPDFLAHMDPPTPDLAANLVGLNARMNQNLLHPALSPFATEAERCVIDWLAPVFGMSCGHMCAGSTLANLTALWCAREHGARRVLASADAHISVPKAAHILGLAFEPVGVDTTGRLDRNRLGDTTDAAIVLTAGSTGRGVIDTLSTVDATWLHVDAAWAGPLRLTRYADRLDGIENADSVAVSAHKWLFQPKDSALVFFANPDAVARISFGGAYLETPNIGVQGSRSAAAIPLLATLLAWGQTGLAQRIETGMALAENLAERLARDDRTRLRQFPETGVLNWRPRVQPIEAVLDSLGDTVSTTTIDGTTWIRQVAANYHADLDTIWRRIDQSV